MTQYHLADIYTLYWSDFLKQPETYLPARVFKAVNQTLACRTPKLGTRVYRCPDCERTKVVHHSCKNRFCPRCGYTETQAWADRLMTKIAPIRHHHVTFTLSEGLLPIAMRFPNAICNALFSAASWVLKDWFEYKHQLIPGIVAVLHTAGFALKKHIHLHVLVTGGGVKNGRWHELQRNYLTRIDHFRKKFRWRFEHDLLLALQRGELGSMSEHELKQLFLQLNQQQWVVAVQKGMYKPEHVVRYIGRYIKRAPLSEYKIKSIDDGTIRFECKDYRNSVGGKPAAVVVSLTAHEFLKRLLVHVPLEGFHTVRYYGAYHGSQKSARPMEQFEWRELQLLKTGTDPLMCPYCQTEMVYCGMEFPEVQYAKTG
ncbi:MAG: transposase [Ignavibacteriae bacterium]|nr:transposase [Ignavibacteriota bacterium]